MKIDHIKISNVLGIESLEFDAGQFNAIVGPNGAGKSSVLEAIKAALSAGTDATLIRAGAERGEVVLVLDNGGTISAKIGASGTTRSVKGPDGKASPRPVEALRQLVDLMAINPVAFLTAKPADRARVLLESMPLQADIDLLSKLSGRKLEPAPDTHALAVIEEARRLVYDDRTGTNRAVREKDATINQLRAAIPPAPAGVDGDEEDLLAQLKRADEDRQAEIMRIEGKLVSIRATDNSERQRLRAEAQAKIDAINSELSEALQAAAATLAKTEAAAATQRERTITKHAAATAPLNAALAAIRQNRETAGRRSATLATIKQLEAELSNLQDDAQRQTAAIGAIDEYRASLLSDLPIQGLEVRDGDIYRGGIQFDRLNTAQRVGIAVEVAKLRAGRLGVCCVDGLELMDTKTWESFRDAASQSDLQLFVTRVADDEGLTIETAD